MSDTVKIVSKLPMALTIQEPVPNPDKPGLAPPLRSAVLYPVSHPTGRTSGGVTEVDADVYRKWLDANPNHTAVLNGSVYELDGDVSTDRDQYGFEPALEAAAADAAKASEGSTIKHEGPISSVEMAATSDVPNDDSPRSQTKSTAEASGLIPTPSVPVAPSALVPAKK